MDATENDLAIHDAMCIWLLLWICTQSKNQNRILKEKEEKSLKHLKVQQSIKFCIHELLN